MYYILFIFTPLIIYLTNNIIKKKRFFHNYSGDLHQKYSGEKLIPLAGGLYLIFFFIFFLYKSFLLLYFFLFVIFLIGLLSDFRIVNSPLKRLLMQTVVVIFFVYFFELQLISTRIIFLDIMLTNIYFSIFFTSFCLIILMNGSNFIDGLNSLVLVYYTIILIILFNFDLLLNFTDYHWYFLIYFLSILIIFNFNNIFYLGDSGTYLLSFFTGFLVIDIYNNNSLLSPFFVVLLLWYPCFENLFSIIRKFKLNKSPINPDTKHLHQLVFFFIFKKFKTKKNFANNFASISINIYNLILFYLGTLNMYNSQYLIVLIVSSVTIYTIIYLRLFKYKFGLNV
jgi:UDP-N-acetylmuramyl pentapeptide phosphotransferase/UDP-N-acetylglucosamine-1-phosphate transferase